MHGVVDLLLGDRTAAGERRVAGDVELRPLLGRLGPGEVGLSLGNLGPGLLELRLRQQERGPGLMLGELICPGIDFEEDIAGLDERPFLVVLAHQVPGHAGSDLSGDVSHRGTDPFAVNGHVLLGRRLDFDGRQWFGRGLGRLSTPGGERDDHHDQQAAQEDMGKTHGDDSGCAVRAHAHRPVVFGASLDG